MNTKETTNSILKHISTDYDNSTFDTGRVLVVIVVLTMVFLAGWDVIKNAAPFDAQSFGAGVGAILLGLGAYIFGDNKRPVEYQPPLYNPYVPDTAPQYGNNFGNSRRGSYFDGYDDRSSRFDRPRRSTRNQQEEDLSQPPVNGPGSLDESIS